MHPNICPACYYDTYETTPGVYASDGQQIEPYYSSCSNCGFSYQQHVKVNELEEAKKWREEHDLVVDITEEQDD